MSVTGIRRQFPALVAAPRVVYLDSASTTQKPAAVADAVGRYLSGETANAGRGTYPWANRATRELERVRENVARFVGAGGPEEVVFTAGATASLNAVALSWGLANLRDGDEILYNPRDHASNVYPWLNLRQALRRLGTTIDLVGYRVTATGEADTADILSKVTSRTRLITTSHIHNVFGSLTTLQELRGRVGGAVLLCFDCSQSVGHVPVDVTALGADFAAFSAHKVFGAPGTGVLYCHRRVHGQLRPFLPGGGSGVTVDDGCLRAADMPYLLEGGTPNVAGILALGAAVDFIDGVGIDAIAAHDRDLTLRLVDRLRRVPGLELLPGVAAGACRVGYGIVSFRSDAVSASDLGFALSSRDFYVRTGSHCLSDHGADDGSVRVSLHVYNTADEIDRFADFLELIVKEAGWA
ncbi:aminotransferase class V-fold PLP-dependent enzyme [Planosporangium thailandense]|uniref:Aminotransferase class V-fold PLP-dependent enzyme n=1 Tax=Planosporangium thailandense TaxID=765197 RepID=A0ABX0Y287_9ACTN|nr:aminotransferase class V-fold PLP-dependent enzyme [Planosporangium thailandense]NJC72467.1 aminotransferase class V-fold PLP-dependent enzyme [Planosporangium thailandense]